MYYGCLCWSILTAAKIPPISTLSGLETVCYLLWLSILVYTYSSKKIPYIYSIQSGISLLSTMVAHGGLYLQQQRFSLNLLYSAWKQSAISYGCPYWSILTAAKISPISTLSSLETVCYLLWLSMLVYIYSSMGSSYILCPAWKQSAIYYGCPYWSILTAAKISPISILFSLETVCYLLWLSIWSILTAAKILPKSTLSSLETVCYLLWLSMLVYIYSSKGSSYIYSVQPGNSLLSTMVVHIGLYLQQQRFPPYLLYPAWKQSAIYYGCPCWSILTAVMVPQISTLSSLETVCYLVWLFILVYTYSSNGSFNIYSIQPGNSMLSAMVVHIGLYLQQQRFLLYLHY